MATKKKPNKVVRDKDYSVSDLASAFSLVVEIKDLLAKKGGLRFFEKQKLQRLLEQFEKLPRRVRQLVSKD